MLCAIRMKFPDNCPPNCTMIVRADQGTCNILPTINRKSVNMANIYVYVENVCLSKKLQNFNTHNRLRSWS